MRFCLLGPVEVIGVSGPLPLGGPKQRSVLAVLALSPNRVVAAERLIAAVWGEEAKDRAGATLQVYVSNLRRILREGDGAAPPTATIEAQRPGYVLRVALEDVDVAHFAGLVDRARADLADHRFAPGAGLLREALGLWRGDALAGLADAPFCGPERVRLEQARLAVTEERVDADLGLGRHREIVTELEALVSEHPLRERLWAQLIMALYRADRQADALATYGRARDLLAEELGIDPGPALRDLERAILLQEVPPAGRRTVERVATVHLPTPVGRIIGRDVDVAALREQFASGARLLTLTGPGGSGKTRLLVTLAHEVAAEVSGGAFFVDLTALATASDVLPAITRAVSGEADTAAHSAREAAVAALADRDVLLAIDNFEHVLAAAPEIGALLREAPRLRVIVSSQTPLRVDGEVEYRVRGLSLPAVGAGLEDIGASESVRLFVARARATRADFALDERNAALVADICRRLDGLPLAIELAAARLRMLSVETIHARLDDSLGLLTSGHRDAPPRQRTLRAAIEWSVDLLDTATRRALGRLGVFAGSVDLRAALAVCDGGEEPIEVLLENSLLQADTATAHPRFRLLDAVRQYARDVLLTPEESEHAHARLVAHYVATAESAQRRLDGPLSAAATREVELDEANYRVAERVALERRDLDGAARLAIALAPFWLVLGRVGEALRAVQGIVAALPVDGSEHEATLHAAAGRLAYEANDLPLAQYLLERALAARPALAEAEATLTRCVLAAVLSGRGDGGADAAAETALTAAEAGDFYPARAVVRSVLAIAAARRGDFEREKELYEQRLVLARAHDDSVRVADTLTVLGEIAFDEEDYPSASALVREAFALADGFRGPESRDALIMLGRIAVADRDPDRAVGFLDEALRRAIEVGQPAAIALCLRGHAACAVVRGDLDRAARLYGAGDALQPAAVQVYDNVERDLAARRAECRELLGEAAFERGYRHGAALDAARAAELAVRPSEPRIAV